MHTSVSKYNDKSCFRFRRYIYGTYMPPRLKCFHKFINLYQLIIGLGNSEFRLKMLKWQAQAEFPALMSTYFFRICLVILNLMYKMIWCYLLHILEIRKNTLTVVDRCCRNFFCILLQHVATKHKGLYT